MNNLEFKSRQNIPDNEVDNLDSTEDGETIIMAYTG